MEVNRSSFFFSGALTSTPIYFKSGFFVNRRRQVVDKIKYLRPAGHTTVCPLTSSMELTGPTPADVSISSHPYSGVNTTPFPFPLPPPLVPAPAGFFSELPHLPAFPASPPPPPLGAAEVAAGGTGAPAPCSPAGRAISSWIAAIATSTTFDEGAERVRAHSSSCPRAQ